VSTKVPNSYIAYAPIYLATELSVGDVTNASQHFEEFPATNEVPPLQQGDVWIKRHPASRQPSGLLDFDLRKEQPKNSPFDLDDNIPAYHPFKSLDDFLQAEIFSDFGDTDKKIDRQLKLPSTNVSLKSAKDYHQTLALAICLWGGEVSISLKLQ
jgi:hypothetical protein